MLNKKGIGPVVATALLLVVAVVSIVGFSSWFTTYSSFTFVDVEQKGSQITKGSVSVDFLSDSGTLYVTNLETSNITLNSIEISGTDCVFNETLISGVNKLDLTSCLGNLSGEVDVVLVSEDGVFEKYLFYEGLELAPENWLDGWEYRVPINVAYSGLDLSDYQVNISVDTSSLIVSGKMEGDCSDIRLVDSSGVSLINYWIETGSCDSSSTNIWFKAPSITSASNVFYLYYGGGAVESLSNGSSTFLVFDDFESQTLGQDPLGWTISGANELIEVVNIPVAGTLSDGKAMYLSSSSASVSAFASLNFEKVDDVVLDAYIYYGVVNEHYGIRISNGSSWGPYIITWVDATRRYQTGVWNNYGTYVQNHWYELKITTNTSAGEFDIMWDSDVDNDLSYWSSPDSISFLSFFTSNLHADGDYYVDDLRIRKYVSDTIGVSLLSQESN